jgi:hypothetical protein
MIKRFFKAEKSGRRKAWLSGDQIRRGNAPPPNYPDSD